MKGSLGRWVLGAGLLGAAALEFLGDGTPAERIWDYPLFFAAMGLLGCLLLSVAAKGGVSPVLDRREDFYGERDAGYDWSTESPAATGEDRGTDDRRPGGEG